MQLYRQQLQLHATFVGVRRSNAAPDNFVDLFFEIDQRLFHSTEDKTSGPAVASGENLGPPTTTHQPMILMHLLVLTQDPLFQKVSVTVYTRHQ